MRIAIRCNTWATRGKCQAMREKLSFTLSYPVIVFAPLIHLEYLLGMAYCLSIRSKIVHRRPI